MASVRRRLRGVGKVQRETFMRNEIRKKGLGILLILLLVCTIGFGTYLFTGTQSNVKEAQAAGETTTVTVSTDKTGVAKGGTFVLKIRITSTRSAYFWSSADLLVAPLDSAGLIDTSITPYISMEGAASFVDANWTSQYKVSSRDNFKVDKKNSLQLAVSALSVYTSDLTAASNPIELQATIKVADDLPASITSIKFGVRPTTTSKVVYRDDAGTVTDTGKTGTLIVPATINIREMGSAAALSGVKIGPDASHLTSLTLKDAMDYTLTTSAKAVVVSPTLDAASSAAKITIGTSANPTTGIASGANSSQNLGSNGEVTVYILVTAEDGVAKKQYTIHVVSGYVALDKGKTSVSATTRQPGENEEGVTFNGLSAEFNETSTADQLVYVPSDGVNDVTVKATVKSGYGINGTLQVVATDCYVSTNAPSGADGANGTTFKVSGVKTNSKITITVTAKDGKTKITYSLKFQVMDIETGIQEFYVIGGAGNRYDNVPTQADGINQFYFMMPAVSQYKGTLHITAKNSAARIEIDGQSYSSSKEYTATSSHTVKVTAPAGNSKSYPVTLFKEVQGGNFSKLEFSINGTTWTDVFTSPDFDKTGLTYTVDVNLTQKGVGENIYIRGTATPGSTVSGSSNLQQNGSQFSGAVSFGRNEFKLTAATEAGNTAYSFVVNLVENKSTIEDIQLTSGGSPLSGFTFSKGTTTYSLNVPSTVTSVNFAVRTDGEYSYVYTVRDGRAQRNSATKMHTFGREIVEGSNTIVIYSVANNGDRDATRGSEYTININRAAASNDNTLSSLRVLFNGIEYQFRDANDQQNVQFSPDVFTYYIYGNELPLTGTIEATANDPNAKVSGAGNIQLSATGSNRFVITVTAENGKTQDYTIYVSNEIIKLDGDFSIANIEVSGNDGNVYMPGNSGENGARVEYSASVYEYIVYVPYAVSRVSLLASGNVSTTKIGGDGNGSFQVEVGRNTFEIWGIAEDNSNQNGQIKYTITVIRQEASKNTNLAVLSLNGRPVEGFRPEVTEYSVRYECDVEHVNLRVEAEEPEAMISIYRNGSEVNTHKGWDVQDIDLGNKGSQITVSINVSIDGTMKPYTLRITRAADVPLLTKLNVGGYPIYSDENRTQKLDGNNLDPSVRDFYVEIGHSDYSLFILAECDDATAELRIHNFAGLGESSGTFIVSELFGDRISSGFNIVIRPLTGSDSVYRLHLKRQPAPASNTNAYIYIDGKPFDQFNDTNAKEQTVHGPYSNDRDIYGPYSVDQDTARLSITVEPEYINEITALATYKIYYMEHLVNDNGTAVPNAVELAYGVNIVSIEILASDGHTKRTVGVVVTRGNVSLIDPRIDEIGDFRDDYNPDQDVYYYTVENKITHFNPDKMDIKTGEGFQSVVKNADNLKVGMNVVTIEIYGTGAVVPNSLASLYGMSASLAAVSNQPLRTITLYVYRQANMLWTYFFYVLIALVAVELIVIVILAALKRKKKEEAVPQSVPAQPANIVIHQAPPQLQQPMQQPMPIQPIPMPMPIQPVQQPIPIQQPMQQPVPIQQPIPVQPPKQNQQQVRQVVVRKVPKQAPQQPDAPVNVEVKITGMGDNDGTYGGNAKR